MRPPRKGGCFAAHDARGTPLEEVRLLEAERDHVDAAPHGVDDEPAKRAALSGFLNSLDQEVHIASSCAEARALLAINEYDVVLLDLRMPDVGGEASYRELCEHDVRHARRVVFVPDDFQSDAAQRFLNGAGRPVIVKPFHLDDLAAVLVNVTT